MKLRPRMARAALGRWERSLEATLRSSMVPYGYTVTIWVSGGYLVRAQETTTPGLGVGESIAFVAGALAAFAALALISSRLRKPFEVAPASDSAAPGIRHPIFAAGVHVVAIGLALAAGMLAATLFGGIAWFITPFLATAIYLVAAAVELAFALELARRDVQRRNGDRVRRPAHDAAEERMERSVSERGDEAKAADPAEQRETAGAR